MAAQESNQRRSTLSQPEPYDVQPMQQLQQQQRRKSSLRLAPRGPSPGARFRKVSFHQPLPPMMQPWEAAAAAAAAAAGSEPSVAPGGVSAVSPPPFLGAGDFMPAGLQLALGSTMGRWRTVWNGRWRARPPPRLFPAAGYGTWLSDGLWEAEPSLQQWQATLPQQIQQIPWDDLVKVRELGRGQFASVWLAHWRGVPVALKEMHATDQRSRDEMLGEAQVLSSLRHPGVLNFYGESNTGAWGPCVLQARAQGFQRARGMPNRGGAPHRAGLVATGPNPATVLEYVPGGNLRKALVNLRGMGQTNPAISKAVDARFRIKLALSVARGMEYLHSQSVVHFDLKADNLLVQLNDMAQPLVKIGDMGLSKVKMNTFVSGNFRGTLPWMAPELFPRASGTNEAVAAAAGRSAPSEDSSSEDRVTEKVDVFSFGRAP